VLHDADDIHIFAVADRIGLGFDGAIEKMIEQHLVVWQVLPDIDNVIFKLFLIDHNLHALTTEHVGRPNQQWETDCLGNFERIIGITGHTKFRVGDIQFLQQGREASAILSQVKGFKRSAHDLDAILVKFFTPYL